MTIISIPPFKIGHYLNLIVIIRNRIIASINRKQEALYPVFTLAVKKANINFQIQ